MAEMATEEHQYVIVTEDENEQPMELPAEADGTLLLSTLAAQFNGACGLKFFNTETGSNRGVRLVEGRLHPPDGVWGARLYVCVFPKAKDTSIAKRKADEETAGPAAKALCSDNNKKCSDLIVLGLPYKSSEDDVRKYFEQFGELVLVQLKRDPSTNNSKGYCFIRFATFESQLKCMAQRHYLDGRWCEVRIPSSKDGSSTSSHKIFVGRLTEDITTDDLRSFFASYGEIQDVYIPRPFRGFAFVTFNDAGVAQSLLGEDYMIKSTTVHVSSATPKGGNESGGHSYGRSGPRSAAPVGRMMGYGNGMGHMGHGAYGAAAAHGFYGAHGVQKKNEAMLANMGTFSEAVIAAAQSALAQQGWGSFIDAVIPKGGNAPAKYPGPNGNWQ